MDFRFELLREHSARQTQMLTEIACFHPDFFQELLDVFFQGTPREKQLAADILGEAGTQRPQWLLPHLAALLATAQPGTGHHPAVRRCVARVLQFIVVPNDLQAVTFDICLEILTAPTEPIANKVYALSAATHLVAPYPELTRELLAATELALSTTDSAALRNRAARELPKLRTFLREVLPD